MVNTCTIVGVEYNDPNPSQMLSISIKPESELIT